MPTIVRRIVAAGAAAIAAASIAACATFGIGTHTASVAKAPGWLHYRAKLVAVQHDGHIVGLNQTSGQLVTMFNPPTGSVVAYSCQGTMSASSIQSLDVNGDEGPWTYSAPGVDCYEDTFEVKYS